MKKSVRKLLLISGISLLVFALAAFFVPWFSNHMEGLVAFVLPAAIAGAGMLAYGLPE